ncbi:xanthine dehydrogenase family protein molybdopterin-binding subunit [Ktedonosporobacter rubrisoli]|uniref:Xanthine dehydrogenase family protein molybdopterin-binding subunit n=1 Tax=Ktedonosporobacter rubrisoli TaxID=2509675 RepID=A0A4P6JQS8_KTERU|nr:xanthine dehydrogenase family protein molybdopterin-binding subunit [Ktedonosporobacter rubrisoli]QBD77623.1 xanthine dehydrogenase family protein molybdopterin-binding subunit [Ktedonosporobacter rubrisoli]
MAIGKAIKRLEDPRLLAGKGCYVADLYVPGMLEAYVVRSPYAHARIVAIDSQAALACRGVLAVFTAHDLPADLMPIPMRLAPTPALELALQMPLARDVVRYAGEPVAVIVAHSRYLAEDAADELLIDYEPLEAVADIRVALRVDAPLIHPALGSNDVFTLISKKGEPTRALAQAPRRLSLEPGVQRHAAVPLETRGLLAIPDEHGRTHVYGPTKVVHYNHAILARMLKCDPASLHFVETDVGGGFGARGEFYPEDFLIPFIARKLNRSLRWIEDRVEHLRATNHSREQRHQLTVGFDDEGKLLALEDEIWVDTGAYIRTHGVTVPDLTQALFPGPYAWPAFQLRTHVVVTNKTPIGTYRAPGRFEGTFVRERLIEGVAQMLGLDPTLVRERNFVAREQMPYNVGTQGLGEDVILDSGDYQRLLAIAKQRMQWEQFAQRKAEARKQGRLRGSGWAFFVEKTGLGPWEDARLVLDSAGQFTCYTGLAALGQGTETILAQLCSAQLGIEPERIKVVHGDTDKVPAGGGSFASRGTVVGGTAAHLAAEELKKRILRVAEDYFEASALDLQVGPEGVSMSGVPARRMNWQQVAAHAQMLEVSLEVSQRYDVTHMTYPYGVHAAEVEIDSETGQISLERYLIAYDVGKAVNPAMVREQLIGGMAQGLGGALLEELAYDEEGQLLSGTFMDYLLPGACEVPDVEVIITEDAPSRRNPLGLKGSGEGGTTGAGAAIANAVANALDAPPEAFTQLPIRPENVSAFLRKRTARPHLNSS